VDGRIIDLSYNAARALGFKQLGLQTVRLDIYQPRNYKPANMALLEPVANLN
jgi:rare lipoprotein A (peptidoglycan hydrolase)